jgi:hypothetical protein
VVGEAVVLVIGAAVVVKSSSRSSSSPRPSSSSSVGLLVGDEVVGTVGLFVGLLVGSWKKAGVGAAVPPSITPPPHAQQASLATYSLRQHPPVEAH